MADDNIGFLPDEKTSDDVGFQPEPAGTPELSEYHPTLRQRASDLLSDVRKSGPVEDILGRTPDETAQMLEPRPTGIIPNIKKAVGDIPAVGRLSLGDLYPDQKSIPGAAAKEVLSQFNLDNLAMLTGIGEIWKAANLAKDTPKIASLTKALIGAYFATQGVKGGSEVAGKLAGNPSETSPEKAKDIVDIGLNGLMAFAPAGGAILSKFSKTPENPFPKFPPETISPPVSGSSLNIPRGAIPPQVSGQGIPFRGISDEALQTKPAKPVVPATPAEPRTTAVDDVRKANARTIADIQKLFPARQLTREEARVIRNAAWGQQPIESEQPNAQGIRSDTGLPSQGGKVGTGSEINRGGDVEQTPPGQPKPVEPRKEEIQNAQPQLPKAEEKGIVPEPPTGENLVTVKRPDGTTYQASFGGKFWDFTAQGRGKVPSIAVLKEGKWSHGTLPPGDTIEGLEQPKPAEIPPVKPASTPTPVQPASTPTPVQPASTPTPETTGVRQETREKMADAGKPVVSSTGEGRSLQQTLDEGRQLLAADPQAAEKAERLFYETKRFNYPDFAVARAKNDQAQKTAKDAESTFGVNSKEFNDARDEALRWSRLTKDMSTEWHRTGIAQQGETDIDTGSVIGLESGYFDATGEKFTPKQTGQAVKIAKGVSDATKEEAAARQSLFKTLDSETKQEPIDPHVQSIADRIISALDKTAASALARIKARRSEGSLFAGIDPTERMFSVIDPTELDDYAVYGAAKIAKGFIEFSRWSGEMLRDLGDYVKPHLKDIWDASNANLDEHVNKSTEPKQRNAVKRAIKPISLEDVRRELGNLKPGDKWTLDQVRTLWNYAKNAYLEHGINDFDDIRNKLATDLGLPVRDVTRALAQPRGAKQMTNDLWKKQQQRRRLQQSAKRWLTQTNLPMFRRAIDSVPKIQFGLKVGFHGTVALGTHAPAVAFQPPFWKSYVTDFGKMYRMVGSRAYYEMQVQDLQRRPNFITARRAGLVNDPFQYEDYNSPEVAEYMKFLTTIGNRGYFVLKILRQDMFDQQWNNLPRNLQTPEVAKAVADGINHAVGVVKVSAPKGAALALFAPRLELSRVAWLFTDPARAAQTFLNWKNSPESEKVFAVNQLKEKAWVLGTFFSLLALNQGFLSAMGSKQKINFDNPMKSDWMKFKVHGMDLAYGNAMITMTRLPVRLYQIRESSGGKLKNLIYPDEDSYTALGEYARSQMSPFASLATTLWLKGDWENRPLPNSSRPVPKRLREQGVKPYTWAEFWAEQFLPIPAEEAAREVWQSGLGMKPDQIKAMRKALATIAVMSATGARLTDDVPYNNTSTSTNSIPQFYPMGAGVGAP